MMETLFRGKKVDGTGWVEGFYFYQDYYWRGEHIREHYILPVGCGDACRVDPYTVGQYTGITINDERIYEDDVITLYSSYDYRFVVRLGEYSKSVGFTHFSGVGFYCERVGDEDFIQHFGMTPFSDMVKVGNIHDNPELLD